MSLDRWMFDALNRAGCGPAMDLLMVGASFIGLVYIAILVVPLLWHWERRELAFDAAVLILFTGLCTFVLKLMLMRDRPFDLLTDVNMLSCPFAGASGPAMPSGHTARAFTIATLLSLAARPRWRPIAFGMASLVGLSRIYLGVHWPSDVMAGALLGTTLAMAVHWLGKREGAYARTRSRTIELLAGPDRT
jgi:undecaprenyl-diphosphatase